MGFLDKIRRHAAVASGNFGALFKNVDNIPPLPQAASKLVRELYLPEPDYDRLETIFSSSPGLTAKVIQTLNSAYYGLRNPVSNVRQALSLLGLEKIRNIALVYSIKDSLPKSKGKPFDHEGMWIDSVIAAMFARSFAKRLFPGKEEDAFTASLLAHVAIPVLYEHWNEYYMPVLEEWKEGPKSLSDIEHSHFGWDHAQAGAWLLQSWDFSDELVCYIGAHNINIDALKELELDNTLALPISLASRIPSVLKPLGNDFDESISIIISTLHISLSELIEDITQIENDFEQVRQLFDLPGKDVKKLFESIADRLKETGEMV